MGELAQDLQGQSSNYTATMRVMRAQNQGAGLYQPDPENKPNLSMLDRLFEMRMLLFESRSSTPPLKKSGKTDPRALSDVLDSFKSMRATDPRDKVYAFLGLAEESGQVGMLRPAYEKPVAEVFRDTMQFLLESSNSLDDLALKEDPQQSHTSGLNSWVPDFASDAPGSPRHHPVSSMWSVGERSGNMHFAFRPGGALEVRGLHIATACAVHELAGLNGPGAGDGPGFDDGPYSLMNVLQALPTYSSVWIPPLTPSLRSYLKANDLIPNKEVYHEALVEEEGTVVRQSRLEVLWRTLVRDRFRKDFPPLKSTVDLLLPFWNKRLQGQMAIAGMFSDPARTRGEANGLLRGFKGDVPNWDILKPSISASYRAHMILKGQDVDDAQNEPFPEEISEIVPELDAAWAEERASPRGLAMAEMLREEMRMPNSEDEYEFLDKAKISCSGKNLFATKEEQLGVGPRSTKAGDEVWNLVGADAPFVLRPQGDGRYTLLGGAYVHGAMFAAWHQRDFNDIAKDIKTVLIV